MTTLILLCLALAGAGVLLFAPQARAQILGGYTLKLLCLVLVGCMILPIAQVQADGHIRDIKEEYIEDWHVQTGRSFVSPDKVGTASSSWTRPKPRMQGKYKTMAARIRFWCGYEEESVRLGFKEPPVLDVEGSDTPAGIFAKEMRLRVWFDGVADEIAVEHLNLDRDTLSKIINVVNASYLINKVMRHNKMELEVPWVGHGKVRFRFSLKGATKAINSARQVCPKDS